MKKIFGMLVIFLLATYLFSEKKINVVTSTEDMADLVSVVGGEKVSVVSLSKGYQDPHYVEPRPSMVMQLKKADVLVKIGMDLDIWVDSLIAASRNSKIIYGAAGYVDAAVGIQRLEVPEGKIDGSMGDIHIYGNPHYWLDPENAKPITKSILDCLVKLSPDDSSYFTKNRDKYIYKLEEKIRNWQIKMDSYKGTKIVTYHNSWPYFANRFGMEIVGFVEPKPGIPPNPSHVATLIKKMKNEKVRVIIVEPYFNLKAPQKIAKEIPKEVGTKVVVLAPSVGGVKEVKTFIDLFKYNINLLIDALELQSDN